MSSIYSLSFLYVNEGVKQ